MFTRESSPRISLVFVINEFIIWPAPRAGKMNQILRCDWLPKRARWSYLARSGLHAASCKKHFEESHILNPLLTKLVRSRWLDIGLVLFFACLRTSTTSLYRILISNCIGKNFDTYHKKQSGQRATLSDTPL